MAACRMSEAHYQHQPVLLHEVLQSLVIKADGIYVDATFGRGGHAQAILQQLGPTGRLLAMDKDPEAVAYACHHFSQDARFTIQQGSFAKLAQFLMANHVYGQVDGILLDLGVSSPQLDEADRGFSFMKSGKLDMRMDSSSGMDAATWIAQVSEAELAQVLWEYGEERHSRRIARHIVAARAQSPIITTEQLAEIIRKAMPFPGKGKAFLKHPATRSFQAIRIAINQELDDLSAGLEQSFASLKRGGRLAVISFHSLEDRIVKQFIHQQAQDDRYPAKLPIKQAYFIPKLKKIGKAIKPASIEIAVNPRARSATLRIGEKLV